MVDSNVAVNRVLLLKRLQSNVYYLVAGGRRVGKSSMLDELERRYANHPEVVCLYVVLADEALMNVLANRLGPEPDSPLEIVRERLHKPQWQRHLSLIDDADAFVLHDRQQGCKNPKA